MKRLVKTLLMVGLLATISLALGCSKQEPPVVSDNGSAVVSGTGVIRYFSLEGGFYGIVADNGKNYDPRNLSPEFKQDGLRVRFQVKTRNEATVHMWGTPVDIISIEKLGG